MQQHQQCVCLSRAGNLLNMHRSVAVLQQFFIDVFKTSHSKHHVKNFELADFSVSNILQFVFSSIASNTIFSSMIVL